MAVLSWWRGRALVTLVAFFGWKPQVVSERSCSVAFFSCSLQTAVFFFRTNSNGCGLLTCSKLKF
jgi:hypothetical protein